MNKKVDLTKGSIFKTIIVLSLPILGTSFIQMAYSLVDMLWIGRMGSGALAAVGTAGFFTWFGNSLVMVTKTGAQVGVAQSIGEQNYKKKNKFIYNSIFMCIIMAVVYTLILLLFKEKLINFFNLGDE